MLKKIAESAARYFKKIPILGRQCFWILYWCYKITGWHIRHREWDFIFDHLPRLENWQDVSVLDVGCSRNLLCHELKARGYDLLGIDLEDPGFKYPGQFFKGDITQKTFVDMDFITCISVLEHINDRKTALDNMIKSLRVGGRLLLTIPTFEFAQGHPGEEFNYRSLYGILPNNSEVIEYTERAGKICCSINRLS